MCASIRRAGLVPDLSSPLAKPIEGIALSDHYLQHATIDESSERMRQFVDADAHLSAFEPPLPDAIDRIHGIRMLKQITEYLGFEIVRRPADHNLRLGW